MTPSITDRRLLRRKLTFWRIVSILVIGMSTFLAWLAFNSGELAPPTSRDHIAVVKISGIIQDDRELIERLDAIAKDTHAKALILSISSPGGTTYGGEAIYSAIRRVAAKKPVVSDIRTMAASAGYMIAIAGDTIIAGETSITGSIGVIFQFPQIKNLMDRFGVSMEEIKSTPLKAEPSPFHQASPEARAMIDLLVQDTYSWFVDLVTERRKLPRAKVLKLADGSIYTGRQALQNKLIDQIGGEAEIRAYLKGRKIKENLTFVTWPLKREGGLFSLESIARSFVQSFGIELGAFKNISESKLFLDGLVSVWQIE